MERILSKYGNGFLCFSILEKMGSGLEQKAPIKYQMDDLRMHDF